MNVTIEHLQALSAFQRDATSQEFAKVFGHLGAHFWKKLQQHGNLLTLFSEMDASNQALLVYWLNRREVQHGQP